MYNESSLDEDKRVEHINLLSRLKEVRNKEVSTLKQKAKTK